MKYLRVGVPLAAIWLSIGLIQLIPSEHWTGVPVVITSAVLTAGVMVSTTVKILK